MNMTTIRVSPRRQTFRQNIQPKISWKHPIHKIDDSVILADESSNRTENNGEQYEYEHEQRTADQN